MSGIFGILNGKDIPMQHDITRNIDRIVKWNRLYGMNETETIEKENTLFLGCCHEKISDYAKKEKPIIVRGERWYVLDVILFNRDELAESLRKGKGGDSGLQNPTEMISDEEFLADYLEAFGMEALRQVNGDFSGAVYHEKKQTLTLFRDHMGVRPLFYYSDAETLVFSTDIRGILGLDLVETGVSEEWISRLVKGYGTSSATDTEYKNVYCVHPGSFRIYSLKQGIKLDREVIYWTPGSKRTRCRTEKEYQKMLYELVVDAVKRRAFTTSKRVGGELSGGLDSSVIDIIIHRLGKEGLYHSWSKDPKVISYVEKDERIAIDDICRQENIVCHFTDEIDAGEDSVAASQMRAAGLPLTEDENMEFRFAFPPYVNTEFILDGASYMKRNGVETVFSGHAGDEGVSHRPDIYELFYHREYYHYLRNIWRMSYRSKNRIFATLRMVKKNLMVTGPNYRKPYQDIFGLPGLLTPEFAEKIKNERRYPFRFAYDPKAYIKNGGSRNRLDNLALQGACCSVRYFTPYTDYRLIDFAVSIPRHLYVHGNTRRYIFREAFRDIMPKSLYTLNNKSENSRSAEKRPDDWFEKYRKSKQEIVRHLDEAVWGKYLSYERIREWLQAPKPETETEDMDDDTRMLFLLTQCAKAQNVLDAAGKVR